MAKAVCWWCEKPFKPRIVGQRYCCADHRNRYHAAGNRPASEVRPPPKPKPQPLTPAEQIELEILTRVVAQDQERQACEDSLIAFFARAWREIDPAEISVNWHHRVIAEHLETVTRGELRSLVINVPPRCSKTSLVSIAWPAWIWAQPQTRWGPLSGPHVSFLCVSYGATLAEEIALKMRRLVMGEWYQSLWGDRVQLMSDQQSRANFANSAGGERISSSVEGGILGRGGDCMIQDDVMSPSEANSEVERERILRAISEGLATRVKNPQTAARVLIMQRLHMLDPTNYALENWRPKPVHLMFPMRYDPTWACPADERSEDGELLWPAMWDAESVAKTEIELGDFGVASQFAQSPVPRGGGIISTEDWQIWPEFTPRVEDLKFMPSRTGGRIAYVPLPEVSRVIGILDTALSERETADWNALLILGVWHRPRNLVQIVGHRDNIDDGEQPRVIMMAAWRMRGKLNDERIDPKTMEPVGVVQRVISTCRKFGVEELVIENKTRGLDVKNEIERQIFDMPFRIRLFEPGRHGDKAARLHSVQPLFAQKLVYAPANCVLRRDRDGYEHVEIQEFAWVRDVMSEVEQVPKGAHDDLADDLSAGLICLREDGYLALTQEYLDQQMRRRLFQPRRQAVREAYGV